MRERYRERYRGSVSPDSRNPWYSDQPPPLGASWGELPDFLFQEETKQKPEPAATTPSQQPQHLNHPNHRKHGESNHGGDARPPPRWFAMGSSAAFFGGWFRFGVVRPAEGRALRVWGVGAGRLISGAGWLLLGAVWLISGAVWIRLGAVALGGAAAQRGPSGGCGSGGSHPQRMSRAYVVLYEGAYEGAYEPCV